MQTWLSQGYFESWKILLFSLLGMTKLIGKVAPGKLQIFVLHLQLLEFLYDLSETG